MSRAAALGKSARTTVLNRDDDIPVFTPTSLPLGSRCVLYRSLVVRDVVRDISAERCTLQLWVVRGHCFVLVGAL